MNHYRAFPSLAAAFLLMACAGTAPDPYAGYYLGTDKAVRIKPAGADAYQVSILGKSGRDVTMEAHLNEGKLTSEYGGGFSISLDSADAYSMGVPETRENIHRTDSAAFTQWFKATRGDTAEVEPAAPQPEDDVDAPVPPRSRSGSTFPH